MADDLCPAMQTADILCQEIALAAFAEGFSTMLSMCGNAGQMAIIGNAEGDYMSSAMAAYEGDFESFDTDHDDAVGDIVEVGNEIMAAAAEECEEIRTEAEAVCQETGGEGEG